MQDNLILFFIHVGTVNWLFENILVFNRLKFRLIRFEILFFISSFKTKTLDIAVDVTCKLV